MYVFMYMYVCTNTLYHTHNSFIHSLLFFFAETGTMGTNLFNAGGGYNIQFQCMQGLLFLEGYPSILIVITSNSLPLFISLETMPPFWNSGIASRNCC